MPADRRHRLLDVTVSVVGFAAGLVAAHAVIVWGERMNCVNDRLHNSSSIEYGKERIKEECRELHRFFYLP